MSKINITYNGTTYTLEYTRKTVEAMEKQGFRLADINDKPVTSLPTLFSGAFIANHRFVKAQLINEILNALPNRDKLFSTLVDMYNDTVLTLMEDTEETKGNATWETSV